MGLVYRVTAAPAGEYLTVGRLYVAGNNGGGGESLALHNPADGGGTYVNWYTQSAIDLEPVEYDGPWCRWTEYLRPWHTGVWLG